MYEGYIAEPTKRAETNGWRSTYAAVAFLAGKYDVARAQLEFLDWKPAPRNLANWNQDLSLMPGEVAARTSFVRDQIQQAESFRSLGNVGEALRTYRALDTATSLDVKVSAFVHARQTSLQLEQELNRGEWVNFLPESDNDPGWVVSEGKITVQPDGAQEVESGPSGHCFYSRARVGSEFEVRGEFEVVRSSDRNFQAGLMLGLPNWYDANWYGFRMRRTDRDGDCASFSPGWGLYQVKRPAMFKPGTNTFEFRFQNGRAHAVINGKETIRRGRSSVTLKVLPEEFLVGLGGASDHNETTIRYRNVQVRRLNASTTGTPDSPSSGESE
jgi:hypothetical protein